METSGMETVSKYEAVIFYYKKSEVQGTTFLAKSQGQKKV